MREVARVLSSTAYDRSLEREADRTALRYLEKAEIDPEGLATFLFKLSQEQPAAMKSLAWISTHPETEERARYLMEKISEMDVEPRPVLTPETWERLQQAVSSEK
jgi:predicted Zn-dependent protease